jgi:flavin-dependent dehydrogenase
MAKRYDVIVAGAGPAGLMAAKTAAEDILKVLLIERKKDIAEVKRLSGQLTNISLINVSEKLKYGYTESLNLEVGTDKTKVHFPRLGFSIDYNGPLRPNLNYMYFMYFSPPGYHVYRGKNRPFAFFWEKESLSWSPVSAVKAGVEVMIETIATRVENTPNGIKIFVRGKSGEQTFEAKRGIATGGCNSIIVESLGLNEKRKLLGRGAAGGVGYVLEGIESEYRLGSPRVGSS